MPARILLRVYSGYILNSHTESRILNNGWATIFMRSNELLHKAAPLFPYLFILSEEVLAIKIRNKANVKVISVNDNVIKIINSI